MAAQNKVLKRLVSAMAPGDAGRLWTLSTWLLKEREFASPYVFEVLHSAVVLSVAVCVEGLGLGPRLMKFTGLGQL